MTRRVLLVLACLAAAAPAFAQTQALGIPSGSLMPPVQVFPASAVNGAGVSTVPIRFPDGSAAAPAITFANQTDTGFWRLGTNTIEFAASGQNIMSFVGNSSVGLSLASSYPLSFSSGDTITGLFDAAIYRDGIGALGQRYTTTPQTYNLYSTYTDASNYEDLVLQSNAAGPFQIYTRKSGTGTNRALQFGTASVAAWNIDISGNWSDLGTHTITAGSSIKSTGATAGVGYATGAGGAVSQITSKSTSVTLNTVTGQVTMQAAALAAAAKVSFVVTDSAVVGTDTIIVAVASGGTANAYRAEVTAVAAGSFTVTVENITAGSLSEAPVINFAVIKGVVS